MRWKDLSRAYAWIIALAQPQVRLSHLLYFSFYTGSFPTGSDGPASTRRLSCRLGALCHRLKDAASSHPPTRPTICSASTPGSSFHGTLVQCEFSAKKLNENKVSSECQTWKASSMWMVGHVCDRGTSTCGQTEQVASRHGQGEQRLRPGTGQAHGVSDQQYTHSSA